VIQAIQALQGNVQFSFTAQAGQPYTVEYRSSLSAGNWLTLTNVPPASATTNIFVVDPVQPGAQRFYRVGAF
jgi:hypothetical protein